MDITIHLYPLSYSNSLFVVKKMPKQLRNILAVYTVYTIYSTIPRNFELSRKRKYFSGKSNKFIFSNIKARNK